jgi:hypothetical protein
MAVNFAMALNPFTAIAAGVAALVVGVIYAYNKFETFRNIVNGVLNSLMQGFQHFANTWISVINTIINGMNKLSPFSDIGNIPSLSVPTIGGSTVGASVGSGFAREGGTGSVGNIGSIATPMMPVASSPVSSGGGGGGGGGGGSSANTFNPVGGGTNAFTPIGNAERIAAREAITVNVNGGISTSSEIGKAVYDSLIQYKQVYGPLRGFE